MGILYNLLELQTPFTNLADVFEILRANQPSVMSVQEKHLNSNRTILLNTYMVLRKDRDGCTHSPGGVEIIARKFLAFHGVNLNIFLEAVANRTILFTS